MFERDVIRVSMSRSRTISPEMACDALTTAPMSSRSAAAPNVAVEEAPRVFPEPRMGLFELPTLPSAPQRR